MCSSDLWRDCASDLGAPFTTWHLDDAPDDVKLAAGGAYPVVLARDASGLRVILDAAALETFGGDTARFVDRLRELAST